MFFKKNADTHTLVFTTEWLVMGTEAHEAFFKIASDATLLADMEHVTFDVNTTFPFSEDKISAKDYFL